MGAKDGGQTPSENLEKLPPRCCGGSFVVILICIV
jgi:hypothetical protein